MDNIEKQMQEATQQGPVMDEPKTDAVITIMSIVPGTNNLVLDDNGHTIVGKNATVTWQIHESAEVEEIVDIKRKDGSKEVFKDRPKKEEGKKEWKGKTKDKFDYTTKEYYSIFYTKKNDPDKITYIYDPIIQVNA